MRSGRLQRSWSNAQQLRQQSLLPSPRKGSAAQQLLVHSHAQQQRQQQEASPKVDKAAAQPPQLMVVAAVALSHVGSTPLPLSAQQVSLASLALRSA